MKSQILFLPVLVLPCPCVLAVKLIGCWWVDVWWFLGVNATKLTFWRKIVYCCVSFPGLQWHFRVGDRAEVPIQSLSIWFFQKVIFCCAMRLHLRYSSDILIAEQFLELNTKMIHWKSWKGRNLNIWKSWNGRKHNFQKLKRLKSWQVQAFDSWTVSLAAHTLEQKQ